MEYGTRGEQNHNHFILLCLSVDYEDWGIFSHVILVATGAPLKSKNTFLNYSYWICFNGVFVFFYLQFYLQIYLQKTSEISKENERQPQ